MHRFLPAIGFALALLVSLRAAAETSAAPRRAVEVFIVAPAAERKQLESVIRELLGRLDVDLRISHVARVDRLRLAAAPKAGRKPAALAWIDAQKPAESTLYVVDPVADRVLVRRITRARGGEEVAREELAHILEATVEGLLGGETIGVPRREVFPAPAPATKTRPTRASKEVGIELGALYEVQRLSNEVRLTQGPLVSLFVRTGGQGLRFGGWGTAQYRQPLHVDSPLVGASFQAGALRLLLTADTRLQGSTRLRAGFGGGIDIVNMKPESHALARARAAESKTLSFGILRAAAGIDIGLTSWAACWAFLALDIDPSDTSYVFVTERGDQAVMTPSALRPAALLGLSFR